MAALAQFIAEPVIAEPEPGGVAEEAETIPLVGRERELGVIGRALDQVGRGLPQVLEITGEPGIGKTRLAAELARLAADRGLRVLSTVATEAARWVPFAPLVDLFDDALARLGPTGATETTTETTTEGTAGTADRAGRAEWLDALRTSGPPVRGDESFAGGHGYARRRDVHREIRALFEDLAADGLVVILDDLHWADAESIELLRQLLRRPPRAPVLLALAYRQRQAPPRLRGAISAADGTYLAGSLVLGPLREAESAALVGTNGTRRRRRALHRESGGNPFYLLALARNRSRGLRAGDLAELDEVPPAVRAAILTELDGLSPAARAVAQAGAIAGAAFDVGFVTDIAQLAPGAVLAAIDELVAADLVRTQGGGLRLDFRHALVRHVVYTETPPGWRVRAHREAAIRLGRQAAPLVLLAHHIESAAYPGDLTAVTVLARAAQVAGQRGPATAARWLRAALRLLPETASTKAWRGELLAHLAWALGEAGELAESRYTAHEALRMLSPDAAALRARSAALSARVDRLLGRWAEGAALLRSWLASSADLTASAAAVLRLELAAGELVSAGDAKACRLLVAEALATIECSGADTDTDTAPLTSRAYRVSALGLRALADVTTGAVPAARAGLEAATSLLDGMLDGELTAHADAVAWVGLAGLFLERPAEALRQLDRAIALAQSGGHVLTLPGLLAGRALALRATGRLPEATECAEDVLDLAQLSGGSERQVWALALSCLVATATGDLEAARSAGETALRHQHRGAAGAWALGLACWALAEAHLAAGDPEACLLLGRQVLATAGEAPDHRLAALRPVWPAAPAWSAVTWYELLARAELAAGRPTAAEVWVTGAETAASILDLPGRRGVALLARAALLAARDAGTGLEHAATAVARLETAGMALDAVRARILLGTELAARGDRERAVAELRKAQAAAEGYGAHPLARQAATERRRIAARTARRTGPTATNGLATLTRREREVAVLVSEGLSNSQIARRLHVTQKTVEMHVSNVFGKLGVGSRAALASAVVRATST